METQDSAVLILNNAEFSGSLNKYISKKSEKCCNLLRIVLRAPIG